MDYQQLTRTLVKLVKIAIVLIALIVVVFVPVALLDLECLLLQLVVHVLNPYAQIAQLITPLVLFV